MTVDAKQMISDLLAEMDAYCATAGISQKTLSRRAAGSGAFYDKLANGAGVTVEKFVSVRQFMANNPPQTPHSEDAA